MLVVCIMAHAAYLKTMSISATMVGKSDDIQIEQGGFQIVYGSAESIVGNKRYVECFCGLCRSFSLFLATECVILTAYFLFEE